MADVPKNGLVTQRKHMRKRLGDLRRQVYNWDFNVFAVAEEAEGHPLHAVTMTLLEDQGLLEGWRLTRETMEKYLDAVEDIYRPNPYHNNTHAADVTQTAAVILSALDQHLRGDTSSNNSSSNSGNSNNSSCGCCGVCCHSKSNSRPSEPPQQQQPSGCLNNNSSSSSNSNNSNNSSSSAGLSKLERFAIILASAVHDLGHPGVNNAYLVRTRAPTAVTYNDKSVNEMMHASLAFKLALDNPELNIFQDFTQEEYEKVRKLVLEMVLSTDMDVHFALLKRFEDALSASPDVRSWTSLDQRSLMFQMLVHLADLANPSRPWHLALKWAEWVVTEFLAQGDKEAAAGIPISPPCNRQTVCMPAAQLFFIERFCGPTLECFRSAAPSFYDMAAPWLADTQAKWNLFKAAGVRFPQQGYPQLPALPTNTNDKAQHLWTTLNGGGGQRCCAACKPQQQQQQQVVVQQGVQQQQQAAQQPHLTSSLPMQQAAAQAAG